MPIATGSTVHVEFSVYDPEGELLEQNEEGLPLEYVAGEGEVAAGLDAALIGKEVGEELELTLQPADAYGDHDPAEVVAIPREQLPEGAEVQPGDILPILLEPEEGDANAEEEEIEVLVVDVNNEAIVVDLNHPFAGMELTFKVKVVSIS